MRVLTFAPALFAALVVVATTTAQAQTPSPPPPPPLSTLSLEELMRVKVEPVFGASRRLQPVTEAPSSVTIITAEDIQRHGFRTLADILRTVRGFYITNDRNYSYVGSRGFAIPGDYNTRILLLVDGHRLNDNIYDQASVGAELGLDPDTFARVEIIRGPASSLYGTSAFLGVVNIITKTAVDAPGVSAMYDGGSLGRQSARLSFGRTFANGVDATFFAGHSRANGNTRLYFPEFDDGVTSDGVARDLDGESATQVFGKMKYGALTLLGAFGTRDKDVPTGAFATVFGDPRFRTTDAHGFFDAQYEQQIKQTRVLLSTSIDRYRYDGHYPNEADAGPVVLSDFADGVWMTTNGRVSRSLGTAHIVSAGGELRWNVRQNQGSDGGADPAAAFDIRSSSNVFAAYVQDEFRLSPHVILNGGLRLDRYAGFSRVAPRAALIYTSSENQAFKYLFGNAFRAPNAYELDYYTQGLGAPDLRPETINTHELIWERYTGQWLRTSVSVYSNRAKSVISLAALEDDQYEFVNRGRLDGRGLELEAEVRLASGFAGLASYAWQRAKDLDNGPLTNSPAHVAKVQGSLNRGRSTIAVDVQMLSPRLTLNGTDVGAVARANASWRMRLHEQLSLSARVGNLFNQKYADPGSEEHLQNALEQDGRTIRFGLEWHIRGR